MVEVGGVGEGKLEEWRGRWGDGGRGEGRLRTASGGWRGDGVVGEMGVEMCEVRSVSLRCLRNLV